MIGRRFFSIHSVTTRCLVAICVALTMTVAAQAELPIRIAIYDHSERAAKGPKALERILADETQFQCTRVSPEVIRTQRLQNFDLLIVPGGSGSKQATMLEENGRTAIREFVRNGGGYLGICAGSYLASSYYDWSLHLLNANVVDREHWARGTGQVHLTMARSGEELLKSNGQDVEVYYGQGPLLAPDNEEGLPAYEALAEYATEIAENGAPKGVMIGTTAIARAPYGAGRVICFSPHCEASGGPHHMIVSAVLWATKHEELNVSVKAPMPSLKETAGDAKQ